MKIRGGGGSAAYGAGAPIKYGAGEGTAGSGYGAGSGGVISSPGDITYYGSSGSSGLIIIEEFY